LLAVSTSRAPKKAPRCTFQARTWMYSGVVPRIWVDQLAPPHTTWPMVETSGAT
jgi:hypothetical protein